MEALIVPGKVCQPTDFEALKLVIESAPTYASAIQRIFAEQRRRLTFITMAEEPEPLVLGIVRFPTGSEAFFSVPRPNAVGTTPLFDPAAGIRKLADSAEIDIDTTWVKNRDRKFHITRWGSRKSGTMKVAPRSLESVILSYALSPYGQVDLSFDLRTSPPNRLLRGLRIDLSHFGEPNRPGIGETMWVDWEELTAFTQGSGSDDQINRWVPYTPSTPPKPRPRRVRAKEMSKGGLPSGMS